jgi:hypothetical protein
VTRRLCISIALVLAVSFPSLAGQFEWQRPQATVTETGAIRWAPDAFVDDLSGQDVRYIDFAGGSDSWDGKTPATAWKHHPWDPFVTGRASKCSGVKTYVFKRGVYYRNPLKAAESGTKDRPIRLTSTASWGEGSAVLAGSIRLPGKWVRATDSDVEAPKYMRDLDGVWVLDLKSMDWWNNARPGYNAHIIREEMFHLNRAGVSTPFVGLFTVHPDGSSEMNHLARDPDWQPAGNEFAHDYWHTWDGEGQPLRNDKGEVYFKTIGPFKGPARDADLKGKPVDYFNGAIIWSTYPSLMGGATPTKPLSAEVSQRKSERTGPPYDPEQGALALLQFHGFSRGTRYKIENLPQHMDSPGEFYLRGGRRDAVLFYRPGRGKNPNEMRLELAANRGNLCIRDRSNIEVSGLAFRFTQGYAIELAGQCENVTIKNCQFRHLTRYAIDSDVKPDVKAWTSKKWHDPNDWKLERPDNIVIADNEFRDIWDQTIRLNSGASGSKSWPFGRMKHVEVLRNYLENVGLRHSGPRFSAIPAIWVHKPETAIVAGNVIKKSFGSGILIHGGQTNGYVGSDWPLTRILVYHNSTEDTALAVNDYGGFSLWQGGLIYAYNNNIGNSTGHMPGGIFGNGFPTNLSYPYYIDGGYKIYGFNNIIWDRSADPADTYASRTAGYFSVFGFLNHFANNTVYRHARGLGGSSGNRTDVISNVFAEISREFLKNNRVENPSLVGGGDTGASGIQGVPSLAYGRNIFHGSAKAGELVADNPDRGIDVPVDVTGPTIAEMAKQMQRFPVRYGQLGTEVESLPLVGETEPDALTDKGAMGADFRLTPDSPAIDAGATYFIPWALAANVGEWNFTENRAEPTVVTDYSLYMSEVHFQRFMYNQVPTLDLKINRATLDSYVPSPSEDWVDGALAFDGTRFASVSDKQMRADFALHITGFITGRGQRTWRTWKRSVNPEVWDIPEPAGGYAPNGNPKFSDKQVARYPGERRNTLISRTRNLLVEVKFKTDRGHTGGVLLAKRDDQAGYALRVGPTGNAEFTVAAGGQGSTVKTSGVVNDGKWHHVLAEIDRKTRRMTIYLDGKTDGQTIASIDAETSIDNASDFTVGRCSAHDRAYFRGAIDFMRVCHATLADAKTSIEELYAWQYVDGPALKDMRGRPVQGARRDAGALEAR